MVNNKNNHTGTLKYFLGDIYELLQRKDITDIEINSHGEFVWIDGSRGREKTNIKINRPKMYAFINKIASMKNSSITPNHPTLSAILPEELFGCRLEATVPPVTPKPGPSIAIRKPGDTFPITDYIDNKVRDMLLGKLMEEASILICGSTSSGKTSFLNAMLRELEKVCPENRLIILEDQQEVDCPFENHDHLFTVEKETGDSWDMAYNVKKSLRKNPDRIIVGEVRGIEAKEVLDAWNSGHSGFCTLHAGGARQGFTKFFGMTGRSWNNPIDRMTAGEAIDLILFLSKGPDGRRVREIVSVDFNYEPNIMIPEFTHIYPKQNHT